MKNIAIFMEHCRQRKISDSTISKLLRLLLGKNEYMTAECFYPSDCFAQLATACFFHSTHEMIRAVVASGGFIVFKGENEFGIGAFASPLLFKEDLTSEVRSIGNGLFPIAVKDFPCKIADGSDYINTSKDAILQKHYSSNDAAPWRELHPAETNRRKQLTKEGMDAARAFFHEININDRMREWYLFRIRDRIATSEQVDSETARVILINLVEKKLVPYFGSYTHFMETSFQGKLLWLERLTNSKNMQKMIAECCMEDRQETCIKQTIRKEEAQNNHPLSPYEWTDPETNIRLYYDPEEKEIIRIPDNMPPRPSERATLNLLLMRWENI